jgi:SAM-dependent methyltransferase
VRGTQEDRLHEEGIVIQSVADFYNAYAYPHPVAYDVKNVNSACAPQRAEGLRIMVVGCGTVEANMIAYHNPRSEVFGFDVSKKSLAISRSIRRKYKQTNLGLFEKDITNYVDAPPRFHWVTASGVLHHIEEVELAVSNIYQSMVRGGVFCGMVYSKKRPTYIRDINSIARQNNMSTDEVRDLLADNEWYLKHTKDEAEIADTWLHPYFREYDEDDLRGLLKNFEVKQMVYSGSCEDKLIFMAMKS